MQKKSILSTLVVLATIFFTGCATLPSPEVMRAATADYKLPKLPEDGKAIVYVVRPSGVGGLVRFNVFVDDQEASSEMGYTRNAQYIYFNLKPGVHTLYSKAENWAESVVTAKAGDIIFMQQDPSMGIIMARNSMFRIEDLQGKYNVKTLQLGTVLKAEK